jgi:hypothetical protein
VQTYASLEELLADAEAPEPRPGPLTGKPALRARMREAAEYIAAMQRLVPVNAVAPIDRWAGERDDDSLIGLAEELGIRGPVQRLRAALDALGRKS